MLAVTSAMLDMWVTLGSRHNLRLSSRSSDSLSSRAVFCSVVIRTRHGIIQPVPHHENIQLYIVSHVWTGTSLDITAPITRMQPEHG